MIIDEMQRVDVRLLGQFAVRVDGEPVSADAWKHGRAKDLVKLLALAASHRLPRDRVLDALWPQLGADAALSIAPFPGGSDPPAAQPRAVEPYF